MAEGSLGIKVGDRFEITVEVRTVVDNKFGAEVSGTNGAFGAFLTKDFLLSGRRLPRPLKVGDRVRWGWPGDVKGWRIAAIEGEHAAVVGAGRHEGRCRNWAPLSSLTLDTET